MTPLEERVVRLATDLWVSPERLRRAVAALLLAGKAAAAEPVIDLLDREGLGPPDAAVRRTRDRLGALGADVLVVGQPGYPPRLADAWPELGAPLWLFTRGVRPLPDAPTVAIVGTRRPTAEGLRTARELGRLLADHGVVVVSGLARGIDQAAHRGALDCGGSTIAVLGTGLDVDYPAGSRALQEAIVSSGALVTEYAPGLGPRPQHFLWRNRIIAGLADATVVVEGRARSGALQTARLAAAQGRDVLAVPGSIHAPTARGPLELIRDGAQPLTSLDDVLGLLGLPDRPHAAAAPAVPDHLQALLDLLGTLPSTTDALAAASGQPLPVVLAGIGELVGLGLAARAPSGIVRSA